MSGRVLQPTHASDAARMLKVRNLFIILTPVRRNGFLLKGILLHLEAFLATPAREIFPKVL